MLRHVLRRLRDAVAPGRAEARFRVLEAEARSLLLELEEVANRLALRAATEARRRSRDAARLIAQEDDELERAAAISPAEVDIATRKAEIRKRVRLGGSVITRIQRGSAPEEPSQ